MLYSEFIENVGCKQTAYNYLVYKNLEALYMENDSLTKADIYETAKTLVDNSETEAEKKFRQKLEKEIAEVKADIEYWTEDNKYYEQRIEENIYGIFDNKIYKGKIKENKKYIKTLKSKLSRLKMVLSAQ